jgi:hypothetical protein
MAEVLRLRLQVAMYKIRTNQVDTPFDELCVEENTEGLRGMTRSLMPELEESVEDMVAQRKQEAQKLFLLTDLQPSIPKLTPAPLLLPTAFSSRMLYIDKRLPSLSPSHHSSSDQAVGAPDTSIFVCPVGSAN